jgi:drug/metabolite transporter (DMT)-like permease
LLAILLASLASFFFGVLAVTMRLCFRSGATAGAVALATTGGAFVVAAVIVLITHGTRDVTAHSAWPFAVAGFVAPGVSQLLFVRAIELIGASRTAVLVGIAPLLSTAFALVLLNEPLRAGLVGGTVAIVGGGLLLAWEGERSRVRTLGFVVAAIAAVAIAARDNFVRWAAKANELPGTTAAALSLAAASVMLLVLFGRGETAPLRSEWRAVAASALLLGLAYAFLLEALDRGRVTVVTPLYATESLWAVLFAWALLRRSEAVGRRLVAAALLMVAGGVLIGISR